MIDTHCHLTFPQFDADRADVLSRARGAGVTAFVNPGIDLTQSRAAVALAEQEPDVFAAVGIHPQDIGSIGDPEITAIRDLLTHPKVVAIGEVGLEQSARAPAIDQQTAALWTWVDLALQARKPVIFHVRNAHAEFRAFLESCPPDLRGVVHCFQGSLEDARAYLQRGLFLSLTGVVTFPNVADLAKIVAAVPLEHLLVETDCPFLAPQPFRGQRNEPAYLEAVVAEVARLKSMTQHDVSHVTTGNARRLFALPNA